MPELARDSHYVPRSYLERWSPDASTRVWAYRTLAPQSDAREWEWRSTKGVAVRRDLYTSVAEGAESDRIERWLNREVENPALAVLDKLCSDEHLSAGDRRVLARYIGALEVRNPVAYSAFVGTMAGRIESVLRPELKASLRDIESALAEGRPLEPPAFDGRLHSIDVEVGNETTEEQTRDPAVQVNVTIGREFWLDNIEHVVNEVSRLLEPHDWLVLHPHPGWTWYTSDYPVTRLRYVADGSYDFNGRWGDVGTELLLPLSPKHLLYAKVGSKRPGRVHASLGETAAIQRIVAERAYRWIIAAAPASRVAWFRARVIDREAYRREEETWAGFHEAQGAPERERQRRSAERDAVPDEGRGPDAPG